MSEDGLSGRLRGLGPAWEGYDNHYLIRDGVWGGGETDFKGYKLKTRKNPAHLFFKIISFFFISFFKGSLPT